uniref:Transcriptional regulator, AfsR family n=1 Tax=uncultured Armatimonadetes bacterium TaxID=157466 RepID=A0A6J4HCC7_9BACT|nr:Transcriptional regulator, AfsR family [uncultured Armatimonadetes bacterium]
MAGLPSGTVTFLFTDIEGSTRMWEENAASMQGVLARHDALLHDAIAAQNGHVFKTVGDAFCAAFATASEALRAALTVQCALADPQRGLPVRVRMAIHTGTVEQRDGDYFGQPLNRVARLLAAAHGGQTLLSLAAQELVRDCLPDDTTLRDLGLHRLRDLQRPEQVFHLVHPGLPSEFPPLRSLDTLPNNLPRQLTSFVGREREMAEVKRLLGASCLLTLTGSGGCGKTRLAVQVAADSLDEYPDGVWLVDLAALSDPSLVPQAAASALGVREEPGRPLIETLADHLKAKRLLILLDNCEHLVDACARLAERLLQFCGDLRVLATSREALGIGGEVTYRVPSLSLPSAAAGYPKRADIAALSALTQYEAVRLFIDRAMTASPGFEVTRENAPAVAQVCHQLDGIPLAIELAAARVKVLPVEQIAARLGDRFRLLTGGSRTALPKHQTLRAMIDWSYNLLREKERAVLRRLAVFAGGWTLSAAEAVCECDEIEGWEALGLLGELVDKSLVLVEDADGGTAAETRYRLLETVRQYGRERLREAGEEAQVRAQHYDWCLGLARQAEAQLHGPAQVAWLRRLEAEHDNLRAALAACAVLPAGEDKSLALVAALWRFWEMRSHLAEGRQRLAEALAPRGGAVSQPTTDHAKALYGAGQLAWCQGDYEAARTCYDDCLASFRALDDRRGVATALSGLGDVDQAQCDREGARQRYEQSLAICREIGDQGASAGLLMDLGIVSTDHGDYEAARAYLEESRSTARAVENRWVSELLRWAFGILAVAEGDFATARASLEEALRAALDLGATWCVPYALEGLGCVAAAQEQPERAARLVGAAESVREALGVLDPPSEQARRAPFVARARACLGEDVFAAAWAAGRALTVEQAVDCALTRSEPDSRSGG